MRGVMRGLMPLAAMLLVGAAPATRPTTQSDRSWGEPADDVRVSLTASQDRWPADQTPAFKAAVRNDGHSQYLVVRVQGLCEIELDGHWYRWIGDVDAKSSPLGPGKEYDDIAITLAGDWAPVDEGRQFQLSPGDHTLRVAVFPDTMQPFAAQVKAISNAVKFQISPAATTRP